MEIVNDSEQDQAGTVNEVCNFVYFYPICSKIEWIAESANSLLKRKYTEKDLTSVTRFVQFALVGDFINLSTGEIVLKTS